MINEIPSHLTIRHLVGLDPATLSEARQRQIRATGNLQLCESLFWIVGQLGEARRAEAWEIEPESMSLALERLSVLGQALISAIGEEVEHLERLAE